MTLPHALSMAHQGFHVFRLTPGQKTPARTGWQREATSDPERIRALWGDGNWNVGIFTGRFGDNQALLVVDVDSPDHGAGKKDGFASLLACELAGDDFPLTLEHATPTGGRHLVYSVDAPVKQGVDVLGSGLDVRSHGGYIVAPGSTVDAGQYFTDRPAAPVAAPAWLVARCGAPRAKAADRTPLPGIDPARATKRAIEYLTTQAPEAVEGAGGDHTTFAVAAKLKDLGVEPATAVGLMLEHWFDGCGWSPDELAVKVRNAYTYGANPPGVDAPEALFEPVEEPAPAPGQPAKKNPLAGLNDYWAVVFAGGGHHLLWETTDFKGNATVEHLKESSFHVYHAAKEWQVGRKTEKLSQVWMAWEGRRTYEGLVFAPGQDAGARFYNLWRGFSYAPVAPEAASPRARAAVAAWQGHVLRNVCRGDAALARWFTGYMAHIIQRPDEKPLVTLVLKGKKGTGKNAVVERVGALFERNMLVADDDRYLVGNFNSHLEACLLLVLDEASWAGNTKANGKLKGITTGKDHLIERKGLEPYKVRNYTRPCIIGNEDWLVPATQDERRYAVFDVGEDDMQKRDFFKEMREGMEANGGEGYGLLLHTLQTFDLAGVDVNDAPKTAGLADQKVESLGPQMTWWLDCLTEGQILGGDFAGQWPETIATNRLQDSAKRYSQSRGVRSWQPSVTAFNRTMKLLFPDWKAIKATRAGDGDTTYEYKLPTLAQSRAAMAGFVGNPDLFPMEGE